MLVAEDHPIVLRGITEAVDRDPAMAVVRTCYEADEIAAAAIAERVQVAVIDVDLRGSDGARAARELVAMGAGIKVLLISAVADRELVESVLAAGCSGVLLKTDHDTDVPRAISRALAGQVTITSGVRAIMRRPSEPTTGSEDSLSDRPALTPRERDVVRLIAEGRTTDEISADLHLATNTVRSYLQAAMRKLDAHSRVQVVLEAQRRGLL